MARNHQAARARIQGSKNVVVRPLDLRTEYPAEVDASLTLLVLTLQFTPLEHRLRILRRIYESTAKRGALILVEKVSGGSADIDGLLRNLHHERKKAAGYSPEAIDRKALSLEGVLVPLTADWNVDALQRAGFRDVECFWRSLNFAAWVATP